MGEKTGKCDGHKKKKQNSLSTLISEKSERRNYLRLTIDRKSEQIRLTNVARRSFSRETAAASSRLVRTRASLFYFLKKRKKRETRDEKLTRDDFSEDEKAARN